MATTADAVEPADMFTIDSITTRFFQEELENLAQSRNSDSASISTLESQRTGRLPGFSLRRSFSLSSTDSVNLEGIRHFKLDQLCQFIQNHSSLHTAGITLCSCYAEPSSVPFIAHRFLMLRLHRDGREGVWLRLDRRRAADVSLVGLSVASGVTPSNDVAALASSLNDLLSPNAREENRIAFKKPYPLAKLRIKLLDIIVVMDQYELTRENCWAFCSLLQCEFTKDDQTHFQKGQIHYSRLARQAELRLLDYRLAPLAPILSPQNPSNFTPISILLRKIRTPNGMDKKQWEKDMHNIIEVARRWEDSDGFGGRAGKLLAGALTTSLDASEGLDLRSFIFDDPDSQLSLQTISLCRQVILSATPTWAEMDHRVSNACVSLIYWHGWLNIAIRKPPNFEEGLLLFKEATSLLVPGVTNSSRVCWLHLYHATTLHSLGQVEEAKVFVLYFIECVRHRPTHHWHSEMRNLQALGIWPAKSDYLLDLKREDLPKWKYWREDEVEAQSSFPLPLSVPLPPSNSLPLALSNITSSLHARLPSMDKAQRILFDRTLFDSLDAPDEDLKSAISAVVQVQTADLARSKVDDVNFDAR